MEFRSLQDAICEARMSFSDTASGENAGRLNKEMKNIKKRKKFGFANRTSKSDNEQIYCNINELVTDDFEKI
jgi:hypothetical protein